MTNEGFAAVERRIRAHQGEQFFTRPGLPMTYVVEGDRIKVDRAEPQLSMEGAKEIWAMGPGASLTEIDQRITGRAHMFAILRDPRIATQSLADWIVKPLAECRDVDLAVLGLARSRSACCFLLVI